MLLSVDPEAIARAVINPETVSIDTEEALYTVLKSRMENTQRLWWWFLFLVFVLALGETFLANRTYRYMKKEPLFFMNPPTVSSSP